MPKFAIAVIAAIVIFIVFSIVRGAFTIAAYTEDTKQICRDRFNCDTVQTSK